MPRPVGGEEKSSAAGGPVLRRPQGSQTYQSCGLRYEIPSGVDTEVSEMGAAWRSAPPSRELLERLPGFGCEIDTMEVAADHVHIFLDFAPR